jgi:hypothetical protein
MASSMNRRGALTAIGAGMAMSGLVQAAHAAVDTSLEPTAGKNPRDFSNRLASIPRRRDYKTVPMIADKSDLWDAAALDAVMAYKGGPEAGLGPHRSRGRLA